MIPVHLHGLPCDMDSVMNCDLLSKGLEEIQGVHTPLLPDGLKHVYWMYVIEFYPEDLGLIKGYIDAFKKVFSDLDTVIKHVDDDISAHYSGNIFRAK